MKSILIVCVVVLLAGCASWDAKERSNEMAGDDATCRSYGTQPGTDAYTQCRMARDQQRQAALVAVAPYFLKK